MSRCKEKMTGSNNATGELYCFFHSLSSNHSELRKKTGRTEELPLPHYGSHLHGLWEDVPLPFRSKISAKTYYFQNRLHDFGDRRLHMCMYSHARARIHPHTHADTNTHLIYTTGDCVPNMCTTTDCIMTQKVV